MGDEGRGTVWEEIIVSAPPDVVLVGLSATVANVKEIADWISIVHRPIVPIYHPHRPVPLAYLMADLAGEIHELRRGPRGRARVVGDEPRGGRRPGPLVHAARRPSDRADRGARGARLAARHLLHLQPGRLRARHGGRARGGQERCSSPPSSARWTRRSASGDPREPDGRRVRAQPDRLPGAAAWGSGSTTRGSCRASSGSSRCSSSAGSARSSSPPRRCRSASTCRPEAVVLQGLTKRTDRGFRALTHNELTQMAGRAGPPRASIPRAVRHRARRARRARGHPARGRRLARADREPVQAGLRLGGAPARDRRRSGGAIRRRIESSFGQYQNLKRIREVEAEVRGLERRSRRCAATRRRAATSSASAAIGARARRSRRARQALGPRRPARRAHGGRGRARGASSWSGAAARRPSRWCSGSTRSAVTAC